MEEGWSMNNKNVCRKTKMICVGQYGMLVID